MSTYRKKLIEVALPLDAINAACTLEKQPFTRKHPRSIHIWWARRPLAAARAVIFAQMVDDPSSSPDLFTSEKAQEDERQRLFRIMADLVKWENTTNEKVLQRARDEIWQSWRRACADNADHPRAEELFDRDKLPAFHDPFAGGGALPLEAQRLGLEAHASDLNPVAVLINKAIIEIPPRFAGRPPVNPESRNAPAIIARDWRGAQGLSDDVRYYGQWMRDEAVKRIGHLYPTIEITAEMAKERTDLKPLVGHKLTVIAWLWARTVKSPDPAFAGVDVPLASTFMLSTKAGKEAYVKPVIQSNGYQFTVKVGKPENLEVSKRGTKSGGSGTSFLCLLSGAPMPFEYLRLEAKAGRMGSRLMAIVAEGERRRVYLSPTPEMEEIALSVKASDVPDTNLPAKALGFRVQEYGMTRWCDLFTPRQLVALTTFCDLVQDARERLQDDAVAAELADDGKHLRDGGTGATAYAEAVGVYLGLATSKWSDLSNTICSWNNTNQNVRALFARQAIPMSWDYVELSPFSKIGSWFSTVESSVKGSESLSVIVDGWATQCDAAQQSISEGKVTSTDPPYYDNIGYADLSDFFYVWLRRSLRATYPDLFATLAVPKADELVASPYRHGNKMNAETFFLDGMTDVMQRLAMQAHPAFPVTIYYAFKQSETKNDTNTASTGWETFLDAVLRAGFALSGTWPMRTERGARSVSIGTNALASCIVLVCRPRSDDAPTATRSGFVSALKAELPVALNHLQMGSIAPVDLAQAAIGPGMAVYTRYDKVLDAEGKPLSVRTALALINQTLDEVLDEQEADLDPDSRWALAWFEESGFAEGEFGVAETLSTAKVTSVSGMVEAGIIVSKGGKVRLLRPDDLPADWEPDSDSRPTVWEATQHLIKRLDEQGDQGAASLLAKLGPAAEQAKSLAYRLYITCERKGWAEEARNYNGLVLGWPELEKLSGEPTDQAEQTELFE